MNEEKKEKERLFYLIKEYYMAENGELELLSTQDLADKLQNFLPGSTEDIYDVLTELKAEVAIVENMPFWKLRVKRDK